MQSTTSSTRTFQTSSTKKEPPKPRRRLRIKLPKIQRKVKTKVVEPVKSPAKINVLPWILVLVLIIVSLFMWQQYRDAKAKLQPEAIAKSNQQVLSDLHKIVALPTNEAPTIATVKDAAKAKQESNFFANAQVGDKFVYYAKANKTILYRPSTHAIVNFSTSLKINVGSTPQ